MSRTQQRFTIEDPPPDWEKAYQCLRISIDENERYRDLYKQKESEFDIAIKERYTLYWAAEEAKAKNISLEQRLKRADQAIAELEFYSQKKDERISFLEQEVSKLKSKVSISPASETEGSAVTKWTPFASILQLDNASNWNPKETLIAETIIKRIELQSGNRVPYADFVTKIELSLGAAPITKKQLYPILKRVLRHPVSGPGGFVEDIAFRK